jgi:hypothetical protein
MNKSALWFVPFCFTLALAFPAISAGGSPPDTLSGPAPIPLADLLTDLLPVDQISGGPAVKITIGDREGWERKRPSVIRRAEALLGQAPETRGGLNPRVVSEARREGYLERRVAFVSGNGDEIKGYLLIPDGASASSPRPAILALHSTVNGGAGVTVGIDSTHRNRYYGLELARRGYVVLAVDVISSGERIYPGFGEFDTGGFDRQFPRWSAMGKMLHDHIRSVDYLTGLAEVDSSRIGTIGHSLGGYNAFFLQAFDPRIKAAVTSCGFVCMGTSMYPFRFARQEWFVHFPNLRDYLRSGIVPCDMHEVMALCAPRPLFNYSARKDHIFPDFWATDAGLKQVRRLYQAIGASERFEVVIGEGDHDFPDEIREQAYRWLDKWLGKK